MKNTYENTIKELSDSIDSSAFVGLIDAGLEPGEAWDSVQASDFDLEADTVADPHVNATV